MFEHYHRRFLAVIVFASVLAYSPTTAGAQEPEITFVGGGYGHGIGMSQYGAYGRAECWSHLRTNSCLLLRWYGTERRRRLQRRYN